MESDRKQTNLIITSNHIITLKRLGKKAVPRMLVIMSYLDTIGLKTKMIIHKHCTSIYKFVIRKDIGKQD